MMTQESREAFAKAWAGAAAVPQEAAVPLGEFRELMEKLFTGMAAERGGEFRRKPNISLRLIADGLPAVKLIALPHWCAHSKRLQCGLVRCELLVERELTSAGGQVGKNRQQQIVVSLRPERVDLKRYRRSAEEDVHRVVQTIRSFLSDRRAVLARSHDNCCVCGRALTDELSRSRGIGPECIKVAPFLLFLNGPSIIVAEQPSAALADAPQALRECLAAVAEASPGQAPLRQGDLFENTEAP
jgi:hypothetical protein